jgi:uncharacterized protein YcbK (DUF882 family)
MALARLGILGFAGLGGLLLLLPWPGSAAHQGRTLRFTHLHTGESLVVTYWADGEYVGEGITQVEHLLRDFRTGDEHDIEPRLLDLLYEVHEKTDSEAPFQVISGYRSPETNEQLRKMGRQVGRRSLHMQGQAIDIRLADVPTARVRDVALALERGGVGYYEENDFVHIDVGRVRRW